MKQTCCPFCHSAFYVTTLQLNAYKGQARCGQCHQVFDALANLIVTNSPADETDNQLIAAESEHDEATSSNTDVFLDDSHTVLLPQNFRKISPDAASTAPGPAVNPPVNEDELLFSDDQGIDDEPEQQPAASQTNPLGATSILLDDTFDQQFLNGGADNKTDAFDKQDHQVEKLHHAADDSWIEDLLKEDEKDQAPNLQQQAAATTSSKKMFDGETDSQTDSQETFTEPKRPAYISDHEEDLLSYLNRTGVTRSQAPDTINSIAEQKPASHRILQPSTKTYDSGYVFGWLVMIALMLGLLFSQFVYFNFESLAINPRTADKVKKMCSILRCNIPYMNAQELKIRNLKVISNGNSQTTFKASLVNSAKLSQPFPALKLSLKRNGKVLASQVIQPRQYLHDDLKTLTRLATKTPYPIEFTIKKNRSEIRDFSLEPSFK